MIDWMTIEAPLKTQPTHMVRTIDTNTGQMRQFPQRLKVYGADPKNAVLVRFKSDCTKIIVSGNPMKFLTGQNLIGTNRVRTLAYQFLCAVCEAAGLQPTEAERTSWKSGDCRLTRIDIAGFAILPGPEWKTRVIKALRLAHAWRASNIRALRFGYFAIIAGKQKVFVVYDKTRQLGSPGEVPEVLGADTRFMKLVKRALRVEVRLFGKELRARELGQIGNWRGVSVRNLFIGELKKRMVKGSVARSAAGTGTGTRMLDLERIVWEQGGDVLDGLPRATKHRRMREHANRGCDLSVPHAVAADKSLVDLTQVFADNNIRIRAPRRLRNWAPLKKLFADGPVNTTEETADSVGSRPTLNQ